MADFDILPGLTGTGPATITVKPRAVNDIEQEVSKVITINVAGVSTPVTLIQKGKVPIVETWKPTFSINPTTQPAPFKGNKNGEEQTYEVLSYEQQFLDGVAQDNYRASNWSVSITTGTEWLNYTKTSGELNNPGSLVLKTKSTNDTETEIQSTVKLLQGEKGIELVVKQTGGEVTYEYPQIAEIDIEHHFLNESSTQNVSNQRYRKMKLVNGRNPIQVGTDLAFKIPTIVNPLQGTIPGMPEPYKLEAKDFGSINNTYSKSCNAVFTYTSKLHGAVFSLGWDVEFEDGGRGKLKVVIRN